MFITFIRFIMKNKKMKVGIVFCSREVWLFDIYIGYGWVIISLIFIVLKSKDGFMFLFESFLNVIKFKLFLII